MISPATKRDAKENRFGSYTDQTDSQDDSLESTIAPKVIHDKAVTTHMGLNGANGISKNEYGEFRWPV